MNAEIWVAIITSGLSLVGVVITVIVGNKKSEKSFSEKTDLTLYRISELEKKQDRYNHLQERVANMEIHDAGVDEKISDMRQDIKDIKKDIRKIVYEE